MTNAHSTHQLLYSALHGPDNQPACSSTFHFIDPHSFRRRQRYESSDEFYDADEELEEPPLSPMAAVAISVQPADSEADPSDVEEDQELHEDDDASSGVAQNRSIIMHMLSQARVGMDLTRITLPTFILEKRSLLEMYAEFFAHPDLFASIPDNSDPRERIIAIARYYCSAFHAARKGAVAKKPYNPILGETFRCYWDLPGGRRNAPDDDSKRLIQSGPVPYASYSSVAFVAEQVSHHPPVSGFYAECIPKRMYVNGSIYTKSKFLGLSLGVHHIGSVRLCLMDYGEEYRVNLPNAYARSILTVPWLELGGKCHIECLQNGYTADVEFHCKPFYGGRKHRITCNVNHTSERKPLLKVEGEWNGVMHIKHPNGEQEVFFDTINTPTVKKKLQKVSAQDPGESRRRWQRVTEALFSKDIEEATDAKHELEEKQRADARQRQESGVEWKQQFFHLEGDTWIYNTPLSSRTRTSKRHI
ncbi:Oxysterol-binding protein-related protein 9 [Geodia barretti]|uniref:Oxysterol-binding protein n=2 Tax=Geodia barretti TaxID=519541 RepID=A0AA35W7I1_GEOBA|nr:Oxysterol-binding protein-related protein 9 [Geodia barretti]